MGKKHISLENIQDINLDEYREITVKDNKTGEMKVTKTVNRAEIVTVVAYMLGIPDERLEEYYSHHYGQLLEKLRKDDDATIIRYLCRVRTTIMNNFLLVDNEIRYNLSNIDRMSFFEQKEIRALQSKGIPIVQPNCRSEQYMVHVSRLIVENIDRCSRLFPETVKFSYIRSLFVIPKYTDPKMMIEEYEKFRGYKNMYPFQTYMYWEPEDFGYILYSDSKFLQVIYAQNGEMFTEGYLYRDAADNTKESIYNFIHDAGRVVMAVDCENVDPYKLYAMLKNLNEEDTQLIDHILLYDDFHTSVAWDYIETLIHIPIEHIEVSRVADGKSLVDMRMAVGVTTEFYKNNVDSFILCSSDSDFWGLISSIPEARFLVVYEYEKCGQSIKEALDKRKIFHCSMDDFYAENARQLQEIVLRKALERNLPHIVGENGWELTKRIYASSYIEESETNMRRFYDKYVRKLQLKIDADGKFYIAMERD
jgi:hypothetical protein